MNNTGHNHPLSDSTTRQYCCFCDTKRYVSLQSCTIPLCAICWTKECKVNNWDHSLSACANTLCDEKNIILENRYAINQWNIHERLHLPCMIKFRHISITRRKNNKLEKEEQPTPYDLEFIDDIDLVIEEKVESSDSSDNDALEFFVHYYGENEYKNVPAIVN